MIEKQADYPVSFPVSDATIVVAFLRGGATRNEAVRATWNLTGYGLAQVNFDALARQEMPALTGQDAASLIEETLAGEGKCAADFPWLQLLAFLASLLRQLLPVETQQDPAPTKEGVL